MLSLPVRMAGGAGLPLAVDGAILIRAHCARRVLGGVSILACLVVSFTKGDKATKKGFVAQSNGATIHWTQQSPRRNLMGTAPRAFSRLRFDSRSY